MIIVSAPGKRIGNPRQEAYAKPSEAVPSAACLRRSESFLIIFMGSFA